MPSFSSKGFPSNQTLWESHPEIQRESWWSHDKHKICAHARTWSQAERLEWLDCSSNPAFRLSCSYLNKWDCSAGRAVCVRICPALAVLFHESSRQNSKLLTFTVLTELFAACLAFLAFMLDNESFISFGFWMFIVCLLRKVLSH